MAVHEAATASGGLSACCLTFDEHSNRIDGVSGVQADRAKRFGERPPEPADVLKLPGLKATYSRTRVSLSPTRARAIAADMVDNAGITSSGLGARDADTVSFCWRLPSCVTLYGSFSVTDTIANDVVTISKGGKRFAKQFAGSGQHKPGVNDRVTITKYITAVTKQLELEVFLNTYQLSIPWRDKPP